MAKRYNFPPHFPSPLQLIFTSPLYLFPCSAPEWEAWGRREGASGVGPGWGEAGREAGPPPLL